LGFVRVAGSTAQALFDLASWLESLQGNRMRVLYVNRLNFKCEL